MITYLSFFVLSCLNGMSFSREGVAARKTPPNILIIIGDDCTFNDLAVYGGKNVNTPQIDKLAGASMVFNKAYLSMAMCVPCRSEFFTGRYPTSSGVVYNHARAQEGVKSITHYLGELGYRVGIAGKVDVFPEKSVFSFERIPGLESSCVAETAHYNSDGMRAFINRSKEPFCMVAGLVVPHTPWTVGDPSHFDPDKLELPPYLADTPPTRKAYAQYLAEIEVLDQQVGETLALLDDASKVDNTIVIFTSEQGAQFPFGKWNNWDMGVHTGLMVRWPANIKPGRTDALVQYTDVLPTLIEAAGGTPPVDDLDGTSFLPVLLNKTQPHRQYAYCMHNNVPEGPPYPIRAITDGTYHYIHNLENESVYVQKYIMARMPLNHYWASWIFQSTNQEATYNLINRYMKRPPEELYYMPDDPYQLNNVANEVRYASEKERLSAALTQWMEAQHDPGKAADTRAAYEASKPK